MILGGGVAVCCLFTFAAHRAVIFTIVRLSCFTMQQQQQQQQFDGFISDNSASFERLGLHTSCKHDTLLASGGTVSRACSARCNEIIFV